MNIEIRRNRTLTISGTMKASDEAIRFLNGTMPKLTSEQEKIMEQGEQMIANIKEKIWDYIDEHPTTDLDGYPITRETHLIDFDTKTVEKDGAQWAVVDKFYIMPKKSEYESE